MTTKQQSPLPKYSNPPVIETALSVAFARLENWGVPHFGVYWSEIKDEFTHFEVQPPIESQIELFEKPSEHKLLLHPGPPDVRCWFIAPDSRALLQLQHDRFIYNWRKTGADDKYPKYIENIRPAFKRAWVGFNEFVSKQQLGKINVTQCEITYFNHLEKGIGWNAVGDLGKVFPSWSGKTSDDFLPLPENISIDVNYRMPENAGRLRLSTKHAVRKTDGQEIIQLTVIARGRPTNSDLDSVLKWLDLGREWAVRGFTGFTSPEMHKLWGRTE